MSEDHIHDMKDLEQEESVLTNDGFHIYATWVCFDRDCNYHEFRWIREK